MWGGTQQGGGGSNLVRLTTMFPSKKGNGTFVGSIKIEAFNTLFKVMQEANAKGVDLMFMASPDRQQPNRAVLYVAPGNKREQAPQQPQGPFGQGQSASAPQMFGTPNVPQQAQQAPAQSGFAQAAGGFAGGGANVGVQNPPKDEIDSLLEDLNG